MEKSIVKKEIYCIKKSKVWIIELCYINYYIVWVLVYWRRILIIGLILVVVEILVVNVWFYYGLNVNILFLDIVNNVKFLVIVRLWVIVRV